MNRTSITRRRAILVASKPAAVSLRAFIGLALVQLVTPPARAWQSIQESVELTPSDAEGKESFGIAVATSGSTAVVGASGDDHPQAFDTGSAYVLERHQGGPGAWGEVAKLFASDAADDDHFGRAVAISGDTAVIGAPLADVPNGFNGGAAYVFERDQGGLGSWSQVAKLTASEPSFQAGFGEDVAISADVIVVGAPQAEVAGQVWGGVAYIFERNQGGANAWGQVAEFAASEEGSFGNAVAIDGYTAVIGARSSDLPEGDQAGAAYVFERGPGGTGTWNQVAKLVASSPYPGGLFGQDLAIEGNRLAITSRESPGIWHSGKAHVFERDPGGASWTEIAELVPSELEPGDYFGLAVALCGDRIAVGAHQADHAYTDAGAAYVFERDQSGSGVWNETKLVSSEPFTLDLFGTSVSIAGTTVLVGAPASEPGYAVGDIRGLECDPSTGVLYGADSLERLIEVDPLTGAGTPIGFMGSSNVTGLAFDPVTSTLYAVDNSGDQLLTVDLATGAAIAIGSVGSLGFSDVRGLAFDPLTGVLYGADFDDDVLITIDTATGVGALVGPIVLSGFINVSGLAFDPGARTLYGSNVTADELVTIDTATGNATVVGSLGFGQVAGLAYDSSTNTLYGTDIESETLITIDPATGAGTVIGPYTTSILETGSVVVFEDFLPTETYCTAGTSASGCQALIGASGTASATAPYGFSLLISGVEGLKDGLFFYGSNGRQANPWGNGTSYVCVVPPRWRGGLLIGVGTLGACDGTFEQDLNARWCPTCPKPNHNPGAGALVQAQMWYRDPLSTSNQTSSMSDAIEFLVGP